MFIAYKILPNNVYTQIWWHWHWDNIAVEHSENNCGLSNHEYTKTNIDNHNETLGITHDELENKNKDIHNDSHENAYIH